MTQRNQNGALAQIALPPNGMLSFVIDTYRTFATCTLDDLKAMGLTREGSFPALQSRQPREVFPATGYLPYWRRVKITITHIRAAPYLSNSKIRCTPLDPETPIMVIKDPKNPNWVFIKGSGGLSGWVGEHHVSSAPAPPPVHVLAPAHGAVISTSFNVVASGIITYTHMAPSVQSSQVGYIVPRGSALIVIAVSSCRQWFQLLDNTWIPASWVQ